MTEHEQRNRRQQRKRARRLGTARGPRTSFHRRARALVPSLRHASTARLLELARHHRRADRARRDRRRQPEGRVRHSGLGHPEGDRPDRVGVRVRAGRSPESRLRRAPGPAAGHARAQAGDRGRDRGAQGARVQADQGRRWDRERRRSVRSEHVLRRRADRLCGSPVRQGHLRQGRDSVVKVEDAVREAVAPAGVTVEYNGDAEFPPIEQGSRNCSAC